MTAQIIECEQGSDDWWKARMGLPTASEFSSILAKGEGKTRRTYMLKLAGEILTEEVQQQYTNEHMLRGKIMEDEARDMYAFMKDVEPVRVGFIRNEIAGCSPDSLIGTNAGLEIKTALPHIQIDRIMKDELPAEHKAQVQGGMWVSERDTWDFVSYWPKLPLFVKTVKRDKEYIANLVSEINRFNDELQKVVEQIRNYGIPKSEAA